MKPNLLDAKKNSFFIEQNPSLATMYSEMIVLV